MHIMFGQNLATGRFQEGKTALMSKRVTTDMMSMRRYKTESDTSICEKPHARSQYFRFRSLYIAMQKIDTCNPEVIE